MQISPRSPDNSPARQAVASAVRTAVLVILSVVLSTLVRSAFNPIFGRRVAFITYFPALVFGAWVGGWPGGLGALLLSALAAIYFFISPSHAFIITSQSDQATLIVFIAVGLGISAISSAQHKAHREAVEAVRKAQQTTQALQDSEARKAAVLEAALDCIITIDDGGLIVEFNPAAEKMFGYRAEEVVGRSVAETIIPPALRRAHLTGLEHYLKTGIGPVLGQRIEVIAMRKGSTEFPVELAIVPMRHETVLGFTAYLRDISERKALEAEQTRLADANRLLLESTGEGIYGIDTEGQFTFVNQAAARILGFLPAELIGRSGHQTIHQQHEDGTPYPEEECPIYQAIRSGKSVHVENEVFWRADRTPFPVSYSAAPISSTLGVQGAVVTFSDITERRALERARARVAEREHRIAEQLQAALQPVIPASVPGLELADYYRPALDEAGVGGDFVDVFAADKGVTFLVVGDLSGKGLAAASQVAIVRNMLRFALYNGRSLAGPITTLSRTLEEHDLLTGFATLFVGRYDASDRILSYVNCGQDAGLVLRAADRSLEALMPTGPVLGAFPGAEYIEETISLAAGDALALFTDGLTEAGPSHTALLTGDGVGALLLKTPETGSAQAVLSHLISGVDAYAQGGTRDDQCLLVGIAA